jgi:hypothetical protein
MKRCAACTTDPDPRGPSACAACRELERRLPLYPDLSDEHVERVARRLFRAFDDAMMSPCEPQGVIRLGDNWRSLAQEAIRLGAVVPRGES